MRVKSIEFLLTETHDIELRPHNSCKNFQALHTSNVQDLWQKILRFFLLFLPRKRPITLQEHTESLGVYSPCYKPQEISDNSGLLIDRFIDSDKLNEY